MSFSFFVLMISGGFYFNICISASLLRPPPTYNNAELGDVNTIGQYTNELPLSPNKLMNGEKEITLSTKTGHINLGFKDDYNHITVTDHKNAEEIPSPVVKNYVYGVETMKYEQCTTSYQIILTNVAFIRLFVMMILASFAVFSILYVMPPLATEWGASEVTASLTVTVSGGSELISR